MAEPDNQTSNSDVAMFIDWENMHGSIRGKANISALREVAEPRKDAQTAGTELPDDIDVLFQEIVTMIETSTQSKILLTSVKQSLIKKYGGFDEAVYGYNRLKELIQEGERLGYFTIGRNNKEIDYVFLAPKRTPNG